MGNNNNRKKHISGSEFKERLLSLRRDVEQWDALLPFWLSVNLVEIGLDEVLLVGIILVLIQESFGVVLSLKLI